MAAPPRSSWVIRTGYVLVGAFLGLLVPPLINAAAFLSTVAYPSAPIWNWAMVHACSWGLLWVASSESARKRPDVRRPVLIGLTLGSVGAVALAVAIGIDSGRWEWLIGTLSAITAQVSGANRGFRRVVIDHQTLSQHER